MAGHGDVRIRRKWPSWLLLLARDESRVAQMAAGGHWPSLVRAAAALPASRGRVVRFGALMRVPEPWGAPATGPRLEWAIHPTLRGPGARAWRAEGRPAVVHPTYPAREAGRLAWSAARPTLCKQ